MTMANVIFDFGAVLIQWDVERAFPDVDDVASFLDASDFFAWNTLQDGGRSQADAIAAAIESHPEHAPHLAKYFDNFADAIQVKTSGSWEVLEDLREKGHRIFGLTNWAAETYLVAEEVHPEIKTVFEDVVVSGREKMLKPHAEIYECLLSRNGLVASECVFIDDSKANVAGGEAVGIDSIHFTDARALRIALEARGLL